MSEQGDMALKLLTKIDSDQSKIVEIMGGVMKSTYDNVGIIAAVAPVKDKLGKLHDAKYQEKEYTTDQLFSMLGVVNQANVVEENRTFWRAINVAITNAILKSEGFKQGDNGVWKVGI